MLRFFFCVRQCVCSQWHILSLCCFFIFGNATQLCWVLCGRMHLHVTLNTIDGWFKSSKSERSLIFAWHRNKLIIFVFLMCLFPLYLCAGQCLYTKSIPYFDYPNLHIFSWNFWTHKIYATREPPEQFMNIKRTRLFINWICLFWLDRNVCHFCLWSRKIYRNSKMPT